MEISWLPKSRPLWNKHMDDVMLVHRRLNINDLFISGVHAANTDRGQSLFEASSVVESTSLGVKA
jgi:hypothetical protein